MDFKDKKIAFLGAGNMGEAMLRGLLKSGLSTPQGLIACDLREEKLAQLSSELGIRTYIDARQAVKQADIIALAVKPQGIVPLLDDLRGQLRPEQLVISIIAGLGTAKIEAALPGIPVVRVMPNTPALLGLGASAFSLGKIATSAHANMASILLGCLGLVLQVEESQMDAVTALSGSGPAYVFLFMEALESAGKKLGLDGEQSFKLAAQTLTGAAAMIQARADTPEALRRKVTSPGGTTEAAIKVFEAENLRGLVEKAMGAARDRSAELGLL
jgi:pyrroline-5-carboxylate reductase